MLYILIFLFLVSVILTNVNYRLALFMFPDSVIIRKFHGFLGWYGLTNLFVSIPFLWDGDYRQGSIPFFLGLIPLLGAIILVFRANSNINIFFPRGLKIFLKSDEEHNEPGNDKYGFLDNPLKRMKEIGPKYYFKEIFARDRENLALSDTLLDEGAEATLRAITVLPWVQDNAVTVKSQIVFLFHYLIRRYNRQKLITNFDRLAKNAIELCSLADLKFHELPYTIACFIAQANALLVNLDKDEELFCIQMEGYTPQKDEKIIAQFLGYEYSAADGKSLINRIKHALSLRYAARRCFVTFTNLHVIVRVDGQPDRIDDLSVSKNYIRCFGSISMDGQTFFKFKRTAFFKFVVDMLNN